MYLTWRDVLLMWVLVMLKGSQLFNPAVSKHALANTYISLFLASYLISSLVGRFLSTRQPKK